MTAIYWFRNDLRLHDNPALRSALCSGHRLHFVYCHAPRDALTPWGFVRVGVHRRHMLRQSLDALRQALAVNGHVLIEGEGVPEGALTALAGTLKAECLYAEAIEAPEERAAVRSLRARGLKINLTWQSSLLDPEDLPFAIADLPEVFTTFRQLVEKTGVRPPSPVAAPVSFPPSLPCPESLGNLRVEGPPLEESRSSFPYHDPCFAGGEEAALMHLKHYFAKRLPDHYKKTRNELSGREFSSKFSPWLAQGSLSARKIHETLVHYEVEFGQNEGTYWLWFELLWRDYFRFLQIKHGLRLYRSRGLRGHGPVPHDAAAFTRWREGQTGEPLIDAGMRELSSSGYLSNRMRQIVASYLVHDLQCDWRAGAAWFESQLVDYDVYSNQGNWLYIAGFGTDPRGGRRFDPEKQTRTYDPSGCYRSTWLGS